MQFSNISIPEIYKTSSDFRFFIDWFSTCLEKIKYDHENLFDLYDPLRCPDNLLWCLADTMGFKYDDRMPVAFNRLVLIYFMSMIRLKGCRDGIMLAAEVNLAQFSIIDKSILGYFKDGDEGKPEWVDPVPILQSRLEDTNIPTQSVSVTPYTEEGYIEVVYFSNRKPVDCCIEYVRPVGMYLYQISGVKFDARTKISVDARLTHNEDRRLSIGPTHVGHYSREDYARLQEIEDRHGNPPVGQTATSKHIRNMTNYRNSRYEDKKYTNDPSHSHSVNPGYRTLYSLELANNDHIVNSLIRDPESGKLNPPDKIFSIGYNPIEVTVASGPSLTEPIMEPDYADKPLYNLRYDAKNDKEITEETFVTDPERTSTVTSPKPAVNPVMLKVGDAITHTEDNTLYSESNDDYNQRVTKK